MLLVFWFSENKKSRGVKEKSRELCFCRAMKKKEKQKRKTNIAPSTRLLPLLRSPHPPWRGSGGPWPRAWPSWAAVGGGDGVEVVVVMFLLRVEKNR